MLAVKTSHVTKWLTCHGPRKNFWKDSSTEKRCGLGTWNRRSR